MKIAILTDTHHGARNNFQPLKKSLEHFYENIFFPECDKRGITNVIHCGDFFDNRKSIDNSVLYDSHEIFLGSLVSSGMNMYIIPGNHDVYYKNTNEINSLYLHLRDFKCITILEDPVDITFGDQDLAFIPWINEENERDIMQFVADTKSKYLFGHLELSGFPLAKANPNLSEGMGHGRFSKFDSVFSGHYHTKSNKDNIHYLGSPVQFTWADVDDNKGFHIFDTETGEIEFIPNTFIVYKRFFYDTNVHDEDETLEYFKEESKNINGCIVKVIITSCKNDKHFKKCLNHMEKGNPFDLLVIDNEAINQITTVKMENIKAEDSVKIIEDYIDTFAFPQSKEKYKNLLVTEMKKLHREAQDFNPLV